jgi:PAS domain-containing protein
MLNDLLLILAAVLATAGFGIWWVLRPAIIQKSHAGTPPELPTVLFKNGVIEHANAAALHHLPIVIGAHNWDDIFDILSPDYADFPPHPLALDINEQTVRAECGTIRINRHKDSLALTFHLSDTQAISSHDHEELRLLRMVNEHLPYPAWKTDHAGTVIWHNGAYGALAARLAEDAIDPNVPVIVLPEGAEDARTARVKVKSAASDAPEWFNVTRCPLPCGAIYHATSLSELIKAEEAQHDFVQTLAKTFAHLSIGLAIFNRDRQLALFNPALIDLTGLSVTFLSPRPTIDSFFDAMRENRRMAEPKNYKTWRHRMADLISAAEMGKFEETWSLETGQTYRVTGRPHPNGAIAFLMEDISAAISLTRNFRAELELGQSLVDTFEDALAVFSQSGVLTFSNKAYDLLWGFQGDTTFADVTITDAVRLWREKSAPNPLWQELQDSVMTLGEREEWAMPVCLKGDIPMQCKIVPIASGATVVRFSRPEIPTTLLQDRSEKTAD